ncbi:MAG: MFS transporter [Caulobacteraceae bacterium]
MNEMTGIGISARAGAPSFSAGYKRAVLGLLVMAYTFNFIDRTIISTIGQAIKVDLKITDTQLGLLGGLSFAILYTLLGVPIARLAERWNRVSIIAIAMVVWSAFTAACGLAGNFVQLMALRVGVGVGEAGCSPPSHSLISDYFEPQRRASALSIYAFGIPLGAMIGAIAGGWLAQKFGWRVAFIAVGAPGVILALAIKLIVREPPRGHSEPPATAAAVRAPSPANGSWLVNEFRELAQVTASLFGRWPVLNIVLGVTIASFAGYGAGAFAPPYFNRAFGLDYATVGLIFGLIGGVSAGIGTVAGGFIADWAARSHPRWRALVPAIGLAIATPIFIVAYSRLDWKSAALVLLLPGAFAYTYLGPTFGVIQNVVDTRRRATAAAVLFLFLNIIALGGGPLFTGWLIDAFAQFHFTHPGGAPVWKSLAGLLHTPGAETFSVRCPGGEAPAGAPPGLVGQCETALVLGTRQGIIVTVCFYGWAAVHYLLGSIGLARQLTDAARAHTS